MAHQEKNTSIIDYSKWDDVVMEDDFHIDVEAPFNSQIPNTNTTNITKEDAQRIKIPRSPRPLPAEPPVLASPDGLLEPPPLNAPKGAAAVRHYQVGFRHKIINKNKNRNKHRKAASMTVFDEMQEFLSQSHEENDKKYGITVEDDQTELLKECGELLQFMKNEAQQQTTKDSNEQEQFNPSHHDYYKHNPHEYYRHKAMQTHGTDVKATDAFDIPKIDVVVKLGGAFITDKTKMHCLKQDNIDIAARHISDAFKANYRMILIHGAGSYGHFEAKKYKLMKGLYCDESTQGMVVCRAAVSILHQHVLAKLMEYRIPVISVSPNNIITSTDGVVSRRQFKPFIAHIKRIIKYGMVPLIHGDVIFDEKRGCNILSGDVILENLCSTFNPQRAVFWSNIEGVYDCSDVNKKYRLIPSIDVNPQGIPQLDVNVVKQLKNPETFFNEQQNEYMKKLSQKFDEKLKNDGNGNGDEKEGQQQKEIKKADMINIDVTGGMWGKIEVAARCCAQGIDVIITKGATDDAKSALLGKCAENATVFVPTGTFV